MAQTAPTTSPPTRPARVGVKAPTSRASMPLTASSTSSLAQALPTA
jgi:hypothetical protein